MKMSLLILFTLISCSCAGQKQNNTKHVRIVRSFLNSVIEGTSDDSIIKQHLSLSDSSSRMKEYTAIQLDALREKLKGKHESNFIFSPYDSTVNSDLMVSRDKQENILIVSYQGKMFLPVLVEGDRIKAFSVINKGKKKIFLLL